MQYTTLNAKDPAEFHNPIPSTHSFAQCNKPQPKQTLPSTTCLKTQILSWVFNLGVQKKEINNKPNKNQLRRVFLFNAMEKQNF
jgi:hypothetical protein